MSDRSPVHPYYYSTYHLAGDLVWGVSVSSLFLGLACLLDPETQAEVSSVMTKFDSLKSTPLVIAGIGLCVLVMATLSMIAHRLSVVIRDTIHLVPGLEESIGYKKIYRRHEADVLAMYLLHFPDKPILSIHKSVSPIEMVNRLGALMKLYNPEGYNHNYRTYTIVAAFRQSIVYCFVLALVLFGHKHYSPGLFLFGLMALFILCLKFATEQSVSTEFDFIVATSQWISNLKQSGNPALATEKAA